MIQKQTQIAFLESLYGIFFNSAGEFASKKADIINAVTDASALKVWRKFDYGEDVVGLLTEVRKGKNVELKPFGVHLKKMMQEDSSLFTPAAGGAVLKFALYFRTGSEGAARSIQKLSAAPVFSPWVRTGFEEKKIDQSSVADELKQFVKKVTKKVGLALSRDEAEELREKNRVQYKEYLKLRKAFSDAWKNSAANFIRSSGKKTVPMKDLISHLDSQGLEYGIVPGFTGNVGLGQSGDMEWYTSDGSRIVGVPSPTFFAKVEMNESAKKPGAYVFTAIPGADNPEAKPKYFYKAEDLKQRREQKFQMIQDVAPRIKDVRQVWLAGLRHFDLDDDKTVAALLLELSYEFASRIGTEGNATKGQSTYGLSTTQVRHLKMMPNGFTLTYQGKDNVKTSHKFTVKDATGRAVMEAMKQLVEGKEPSDPIFTVGSEEPKPIRPSVVNHVFRRLTGHAKIGSHKMRTLRGTVLFTDLVEKFLQANAGKEVSQKEAEAELKMMAAKVGQVLNHVRTSADGEPKVTGDTALNAYIDPSAQARFFDELGLSHPKSLLKRMGNHRIDSFAVIAADEEPSEEELDSLEEDLGDEAFSDPLPADDSPESGEDPTEEGSDEVIPADEPDESGESADGAEEEEETPAEPSEEKESPEDSAEEPKKEKDLPPEEPKSSGPTMDDMRQLAEDSAEEDSALLSRILQDPGVADNN